jgi:hypothetical protein
MCTSTLSPSRLFPIVGALSSCGISYGSEAATGLDSNEMSYSPLKWAGTARRILVARLCERPGNKLSPCDLDQNTRSKERTGLLRVQQSFSGAGNRVRFLPTASTIPACFTISGIAMPDLFVIERSLFIGKNAANRQKNGRVRTNVRPRPPISAFVRLCVHFRAELEATRI